MKVSDAARIGALGPAAKAYGDGYFAGIDEMLNQLEGHSQLAPAGCYRGPMPDELQAWLIDVRKRLDKQRA